METGKFLPNVLIEVYNEEENLIYQGRTDLNGQIRIENLPYGNYYIIEKEALDGYQKFQDKLYFSIKEDNQVVQVTMENEQIVEVPDTQKSINAAFFYPVIGLFFSWSLLFNDKIKK